MAKIEALIQKLGFSDKEEAVFTSLFNHGPSTVGELARFTGVTRTHIYIILEKLVGLGIVSQLSKDRASIYKAVTGDELAGYAGRMAMDWRNIEKNLELSNSLNSIFLDFGRKIEIRSLNEKETARYIYDNILPTEADEDNPIFIVNLDKNHEFSRILRNKYIKFINSPDLSGSMMLWKGGVVLSDGQGGNGTIIISHAIMQVFLAWIRGKTKLY
jgi:predicted transcriptional regulator